MAIKVQKMACASCGAPLSIPNDVEYLYCAYCGASLVVERGEGYAIMKVAEEVSKTIYETGIGTQEAIREGTGATRAELKRLQLSQELSNSQMQLSNIHAEIRSIERGKKTGRQGSNSQSYVSRKRICVTEYRCWKKQYILEQKRPARKEKLYSQRVPRYS